MWSHTSKKSTFNKSIQKNLRYRELYGIVPTGCGCGVHHATASSRLFSSIPTRLAFSLKEIVEEHALLEEAHVFLGFNSDSTYVISYTESFGAMAQSGLPSYVYQLHWWLFRFNKKMLKVNSVRLFSNEEILSSLQLYYAEWPKDKEKILVYGCCKDSDSCYITVSAVPPKTTCEQCSEIQIKDSNNFSKCFQHGFVAHMKHSSVSVSSALLNASGMQIDDLIVLNMGHSIGVISLGLLSIAQDFESLPLSSIKHATFEEKSTISENEEFLSPSTFEKNSDILLSPRFNKPAIGGSPNVECDKSAAIPIINASENLNSFTFGTDSQSSSASSQSCAENIYDWDLTSSSSVELSQPKSCIQINDDFRIFNHCNCPHTNGFASDSPAARINEVDPYVDPEPKSIVLLQRECENTSTALTVAEEEGASDWLNRGVALVGRSENCCCGYSSGGRCSEHDQASLFSRNKRTIDRDKIKRDQNKLQRNGKKTFDSVNSFKNSKQSVKPANVCGYCGLKIKEFRSNTKKKEVSSNTMSIPSRHSLANSPVRTASKLYFVSSLPRIKEPQDNFMELDAPTPSPSASESSGSVYCTGDNASQTSFKTGSCRKSDGIISFYETLYELQDSLSVPPLDDSLAVVTENGIFYGPVTFEDCCGVPLQPAKTNSSAIAYSQHLILDVEHVIFDVLRTRCYMTYKFGYLIDYDVQIIDTCSNTRSIVILVVALLNVALRKAASKRQEHRYRYSENLDSTSRKSQQFQFFVSWQLQSGRYEVVAASPLHSLDSSKSGKWDAGWALEKRHAIRKACAIPQLSHCCVYVLSNSSVFSGRSLDYLWDIDRVLALKR